MPTYPTEDQLDERRQWGLLFDRCMVCNQFGGALDIHEIVRKSQAPYRWAHLCNYIRACRRCHDDKLCNVTLAPYAAQLAFKRFRDEEHYDFAAWLIVLGRASSAVTEAEVEGAYRAVVMILG